MLIMIITFGESQADRNHLSAAVELSKIVGSGTRQMGALRIQSLSGSGVAVSCNKRPGLGCQLD